jgi:tRNA(Ile)-lysidine synthase
MLQEDMAALDDLAQALREDMATPHGLPVERLTALVPALRRRILRAAAVDAGAIGAELFRSHVLALEDLVGSPRGREVQLPGHLSATVASGVLVFGRTGDPTGPGAVAG